MAWPLLNVHSTMRCLTVAVLLAVTARAVSASAQTTPDYDAAMDAAARLERDGHPADAARSLEALAATFPQDHALSLRLGWLWFSAGSYDAARRHYERALSLSGDGSYDARLGLAWTQLRLGDPAAARPHFERLAGLAPDNASAREGLALSRAAEPRPVRAWASLWLGAQLYQNHPQRRLSFSVAPSLTLQFMDLVVVGATWRAVSYDLATPQPGRPPTFARYAQQEFYASLGVARTGWALRAHVGHLWDADNPVAPATVLGLSGRLALRGELLAEVSAALFADVTAVRAASSWALTLSNEWSLGPTASVQSVDGSVGGSFGAQLGWSAHGYALSLAARYGDERRIASLADSLTFATDDHVRGAVALGFRAPLGRGLSLALRYDWLRLLAGDATRPVDADAHFFTAALLGAW